jgi:hypothetical protein
MRVGGQFASKGEVKNAPFDTTGGAHCGMRFRQREELPCDEENLLAL